jgi:hypothetical protein
LRLGPIDLLAVPGELYPELWMMKPDGTGFVERPAGADFPDAPIASPLMSLLRPDAVPVVLNQANDSLGYIIPKSQWDSEPPYAYAPNGQYGEENSNGPDTAPTLIAAVQAMLQLVP